MLGVDIGKKWETKHATPLIRFGQKNGKKIKRIGPLLRVQLRAKCSRKEKKTYG